MDCSFLARAADGVDGGWDGVAAVDGSQQQEQFA